MNNKAKKFLSFVAPAILTLPVVFSASLAGCAKKADEPENNEPEHTHTYVYADESDTQHKKTCSDCSDINELAEHTYDDDYDETCNNCTHTRLAPKYSAASRVTLSVDKTELTAGDTFILTVEIETQRTDLTWRAITLDIGPLVENSSPISKYAYSADLGKNFKLVNYETNLTKSAWINNTDDLFEQDNAGYFLISLAKNQVRPLASSEKIIVTATFTVKETATFNEPVIFGLRDYDVNNVWFWNSANRRIGDKANGTSSFEKGTEETEMVGLDVNRLTLNIKPKVN